MVQMNVYLLHIDDMCLELVLLREVELNTTITGEGVLSIEDHYLRIHSVSTWIEEPKSIMNGEQRFGFQIWCFMVFLIIQLHICNRC